MRIAIVHSSDEWYGSDRMIYRVTCVAQQLAEVIVYLPSGADGRLSDALKARGVLVKKISIPVIRRGDCTPRGFSNLFLAFRAFLSEIRSEPRPDLVIVGSAACSLTILGCYLSRLPVVGYLQETLDGRLERLLGYGWLLCKDVICISEASRSSLPRGLNSRAKIVYNSVPRGMVSSLTMDDRPEGGINFLYAGRLSERKGIMALLTNWDPQIGNLRVAGGFAPGAPQSFERKFHRAVLRCGAQFAGELSSAELVSEMDWAHVVVVPSLRPEGLGLIAIEALAEGRPLVATDVGGLSEVATPDVAWILPHARQNEWRSVLGQIKWEDVLSKAESCGTRYESLFSPRIFSQSMHDALTLSLPEVPHK